MSLTRPAYVVGVENASAGYLLVVTEGDTPDATADVLLGDGLKYSWQFRDNNSPGAREPAVLTMKLRCKSAAVVPTLEEGNVLIVTCVRETAAHDFNPYFVIGGRVSDVSAVWENGRMTVAFTVTEHQTDMSQTFDLATYAAAITAEVAAGNDYLDALAKTVIPAESTVAYGERTWTGGDDPSTVARTQLRLAGERTVLETIEQAASSEFRNSTSSVFVPMICPSVDYWPFPDPPFAVWEPAGVTAGLLYFGEWSALTTITVLPYKLARTSAAVVGPVDRAGVSLHDNPGAILLSASVVETSPTWLRDRARAINRTELNGYASAATDDAQTLAIVDPAAVSRNGPIVRTMDTLGVIPSLLASPDVSVAAAVYRAYPSAGAGWSPEQLDILTHLMTDAELDAYAGRFDPRTDLQQTLIVVGIETDQNMAKGPLVATLTGCDFSIDKGRMKITPELRPFTPVAGSSGAVSWDDMALYWPTTTWTGAGDHIDPAMTWTVALMTEDH